MACYVACFVVITYWTFVLKVRNTFYIYGDVVPCMIVHAQGSLIPRPYVGGGKVAWVQG